MTARRRMRLMRRGGKLAVAVLGVLLLVLLTAVPAFAADRWTDITDMEWAQTYKITADEAASVAEGYPDGSFRPQQDVTRGQFAKMAVDGLGLTTTHPLSPTFSDVPRDHIFYIWVEGGVKAGIISGYSDNTFRPSNTIARQQCNNILGAFLSGRELEACGGIQGALGVYPTLAAWFAAEGEALLGQFADGSAVVDVHRPGTAYLVLRGVVLGSTVGSNKYLMPGSTLTRAQAVAMVVRARSVVFVPSITSLEPAQGPGTGGNEVVIRGTCFVGVTEVRFGSSAVPAANYTVDSPTKITVKRVPAGTGTVRVQVTASAGTTPDSAAAKYTYVGAPAVMGLNPTQGPVGGGNQVVITGANFIGVTAVSFGLNPAVSFTVNSPTQITAVAPAHAAGAVNVQVVAAGGTSANTAADDYLYVSGLAIISLQPAHGPVTGGNQVVINGDGFVGVTEVRFGSVVVPAANYTVDSAGKITVKSVPAGTGTVRVQVTTSAGTTPDSTGAQYTYAAVPTITGLSPNQGPLAGGNEVVITGTNFIGVTAVTFGLNPAVSFTPNSPTQITAVAPAHAAGTVNVQVVAAGGTSADTAADDYRYITGLTVAINQAAGQADPTSTSPINFTVVFSRPVTGFATGDVTLSGTAGGAKVATVTEIAPNDHTTYNVAVTGMTTSGTVVATIGAGVANAADDGSPNMASFSTDNVVTWDVTPPTVTINQAAGQDDPTSASPINFTVVFSKPVTGFTTGDVTLDGTTGATTATVTGSGTTYNVAVSGMTTSGTVIAEIPAGVAQDTAGNLNTPSTSTDNEVTWNKPPTPQKIYGLVVADYLETNPDDGGPIAGAHVTVHSDPGNVLLGQAYTDANGNFTIDMTGVPLGTTVLVQAVADGYRVVGMEGVFDEVDERIEFKKYTSPFSDRRLMYGTGPGFPPPATPWPGLWPD